jgi:cystathionine beta-synthase
MKELDISQIPVMDAQEMVGSLTESMILTQLLDNPYNINKLASDIMGKPFPIVDIDTPAEKISGRITKQNSAVLVKDTIGQWHIITEYDLIRAIAR